MSDSIKDKLIDRIIADLQKEADTLLKAARDAHAYATDEDSQSESKYDTRGVEAAYLADAQAGKAAEVLDAIRKYQALKSVNPDDSGTGRASVGMVVEVEGPGGSMIYFVGPDRGGLEIESDEGDVMVITPDAPIAQAMNGRRAGETFSFNGNDNWAILRVD